MPSVATVLAPGTLITAAMLREREACEEAVWVFEAEWPSGVALSEAALVRAAELELDLEWFVGEFFPALRAEYKRHEAPLWAEYQRLVTLLQAKYERQVARLVWRLVSGVTA